MAHYSRPDETAIRSLETTRIVRVTYDFPRPLESGEAELLTSLIGWRRGSSVRTDESGQVVGCVAHPDDLAEFKKELRKRNIGKANVAAVVDEEV
jgi:hypothetical protein